MTDTASLWPAVRRAYRWVHRAAHLLSNAAHQEAAAVKCRLRGLLGAMARHQSRAGTLASAVAHFRKVTQSYWPGLFHCYSVPDLPRTNNDLEQAFGAHRYHERRATGRTTASPGLVLRGSVRLVACAATRIQPFAGEDLVPETLEAWQVLRQELETRRQHRTQRQRFRRNPEAYLADLENNLLQLILPP